MKMNEQVIVLKNNIQIQLKSNVLIRIFELQVREVEKLL